MFDTIETYTAPSTALGELRTYVGGHREALIDAATLLGGRSGTSLYESALDGLAEPAVPSARTMRCLDGLLNLLMLEHVHDQSRTEAARFAGIDPASPVVEEICLLADGLGATIAAYRDATDAGVAIFLR